MDLQDIDIDGLLEIKEKLEEVLLLIESMEGFEGYNVYDMLELVNGYLVMLSY